MSNQITRNGFIKKNWVMSFRDPCCMIDDVIPGHARIGAGDISVSMHQPYFEKVFTLEIGKGIPNYRLFRIWLSKHHSDLVQCRHKNAIRSLVLIVSKDVNSA